MTTTVAVLDRRAIIAQAQAHLDQAILDGNAQIQAEIDNGTRLDVTNAELVGPGIVVHDETGASHVVSLNHYVHGLHTFPHELFDEQPIETSNSRARHLGGIRILA